MKEIRKNGVSSDVTQGVFSPQQRSTFDPKIMNTPLPTPNRRNEQPAQVAWNPPVSYPQNAPAIPIAPRDAKNAELVRERCEQLCISTFFREQSPVRSLGFTSPLGGSGKSFLSRVTAGILANDSKDPVVLVECNWEKPDLHKYFGLSLEPGLADWLRGACSPEDIRHKVGPNLTFIPAGNGRRDIVKLLQRVQHHDLRAMLSRSNELFVVDLPAITTSGYGQLAASLVQSLYIVVQAGVTTNAAMTETCTQLKDFPVEGIILNQVQSRIPRWIREIL